jgi:hypothetical protein
VTREAQLPGGTVTNQELLRNFVDPLLMRIMTARTFYVSSYQFHRACRIGCLSLLNQRGCKVWSVLDRQHQAEWVRRDKIGPEGIGTRHLSAGRNLAINCRLADGHGSIMTTQAKTARYS